MQKALKPTDDDTRGMSYSPLYTVYQTITLQMTLCNLQRSFQLSKPVQGHCTIYSKLQKVSFYKIKKKLAFFNFHRQAKPVTNSVQKVANAYCVPSSRTIIVWPTDRVTEDSSERRFTMPSMTKLQYKATSSDHHRQPHLIGWLEFNNAFNTIAYKVIINCKNHMLTNPGFDSWLVGRSSPLSTKIGYIGDKILGGDLVPTG